MSAAQRADEFFFFFTCIFGSMDATRRITTLSRSKVQSTSSHTACSSSGKVDNSVHVRVAWSDYRPGACIRMS